MPLTLGNMRELGGERVTLSCVETGCGWNGSRGVTQWPDAFFVPDIGIALACPRCGAEGLDSRPDWPEEN